MPSSTKSGELELSSLKHESGAPSRVLAADDQEHILEALELLLRPQGYKVDKVRSPALVREALARNSYDAVLIDLNYTRDTTSGQEGLDLLSQIVSLDSTVPVIVMTAWANVELAVKPCAAEPETLCRSPGKTRGFFRFFAPRLNCTVLCSGLRG